ncbi:sensor histidine kinase [Streptomyces sp. SCUT-3]|uniref:sensor histidine kinase n=1 Tax=Streptomyces sp. SCUT-3 TaxID=2684469 RepID=UPI000CAB1630|nr:histidine kinase [Streptomyces sp. SCUT-3]PLW73371.1 sensor histidine kinase [Streptomyces sp. DJ]QMV21004.1 sensor histidine kinase [Streptomyces sp. SCUT-3]
MDERPWLERRATEQLLRTAGLALASLLFLPLLVFTAVATLMVVGAGALPETVLLLRRVAGFKRREVERWTGEAVPELYVPLVGDLGVRVRTAVGDPGTYRDLRWLAVHFLYGWLLACAALVVWVFGVLVDGVWCGVLGRRAVVLPLVGRLADLDSAWSRALLEPSADARRSAELADRVEELTATRADAVAAHGAELRRIERDLHDGTQARLVALSMRVGLARRAYETDPDAARRLLDDAQEQVEEALVELRHVVRGIHPPILTDRGLVGAVRALAAGSGLDVEVTEEGVEDGPRPPAAVEAAAYFAVAESLTNAAKHSGSRRARVELARTPRALRVSVRDEGKGGADESRGSGLLGVRRRTAALDGIVQMSSPAGGPTVIEVELPCVW